MIPGFIVFYLLTIGLLLERENGGFLKLYPAILNSLISTYYINFIKKQNLFTLA